MITLLKRDLMISTIAHMTNTMTPHSKGASSAIEFVKLALVTILLIASPVLEVNHSLGNHNMRKHASHVTRLFFMRVLLMEELASRYAGMARIMVS
jgi:hypothetical protein